MDIERDNNMAQTVKLIATSAMGLESLVANEVRDLGYEPTVDNGKVVFEAPISAIPRCNLWLRVADRVKLVIGEFKAITFDELFERRKVFLGKSIFLRKGNFPYQENHINQHYLVFRIVKQS